MQVANSNGAPESGYSRPIRDHAFLTRPNHEQIEDSRDAYGKRIKAAWRMKAVRRTVECCKFCCDENAGIKPYFLNAPTAEELPVPPLMKGETVTDRFHGAFFQPVLGACCCGLLRNPCCPLDFSLNETVDILVTDKRLVVGQDVQDDRHLRACCYTCDQGTSNGSSTMRSFLWSDIMEVRRVTERNYVSRGCFYGCTRCVSKDGKCFIELRLRNTNTFRTNGAGMAAGAATGVTGFLKAWFGFPESGGSDEIFRVRVHPQDAPRILTSIFNGIAEANKD
ncbi:unnamed protein product [Pedinophyceae sp. YPF-701]|nr:unnamed protein product [Pedinophyceae sp. YPF-701]